MRDEFRKIFSDCVGNYSQDYAHVACPNIGSSGCGGCGGILAKHNFGCKVFFDAWTQAVQKLGEYK